jgi:geranylgeranyl diphosphate synthase, type II
MPITISTIEDLSGCLLDRRALVEEYLARALRHAEGIPATLLEAMRYSLLAPGKRMRPMLVILAAEACGGSIKSALPAAAAAEMVHAYSLIHDDLPAMDDDDLRRGLPTSHKRFGEAIAILAGDALLTYAFQILSEELPSRTAALCCRELARGAGAAGMVAGQVEDLAAETNGSTRPDDALETLANIHAHKTGALFRACLRMGAWAACGEKASVEPALLQSLDRYGLAFGQVFQITDDLLDVEGDVAHTGKRVQKDAPRGKLTYPGLLGTAQSRREAERLCADAVAALAPFGRGAHRLGGLVHSLLQRQS